MNLERLVLARKLAKLTQTAIADKVGLEQSSIPRYESGKVAMSIATLEKWAEATNQEIGWFFQEDGPPKDAPHASLAVESPDIRSEERLLAMLERQQELMAEQQAFMERQRQDVASLTEAIRTQQAAFIAEREFAQRLGLRRDEKVEELQKTIEVLRGELETVKRSQKPRGRQQLLEPPARPGLAGEG